MNEPSSNIECKKVIKTKNKKFAIQNCNKFS